MKQKINQFYLLFLILNCLYLKILLSSDNENFKEYKLSVLLESKNEISLKDIVNEQIITGTIYGKISNSNHKDFDNSILQCDFVGRSYKGRGFSCGFAVVEDLQGICFINKEDKLNSIITSWQCNTTAGFNGDPFCSGKLNLEIGYGKFAGVTGFGKINMPLAKTLFETKLSTPMTINLKIKFPSFLKKNEFKNLSLLD